LRSSPSLLVAIVDMAGVDDEAIVLVYQMKTLVFVQIALDKIEITTTFQLTDAFGFR